MRILKLAPAKFCEHGLGIAYHCEECGEERKGIHDVPWDKGAQTYIWPPRADIKPGD